MKNILIVGSGISGMSCALSAAEKGMRVILASPFPSERSQSVMAAGGINAVLESGEDHDSVESHIEDTLKGGCYIAGKNAVRGLCESAESIIGYLESIGTVFSVDDKGRPIKRAFGGQSHKRTCYAGSSTGKQIVSALVMETRRYEAAGMIERRLGLCFHSALIKDGICYGALMFSERTGSLEAVYSDALVIATGGQNSLFGKTTGSTQCDGYTAGKLFTQGAILKNLEFIQYHPTTIETSQKRMLISEAARGEGGRLFFNDNGRRVYFMEDKYGPNGNLLTRDVISREIASTGKDVFLDVSFLERGIIDSRLPEIRDLCMKFRGIDISKEPIPVAPSVHFFMGGLAVHNDHETNIKNLFAVGECASIYHGANRLGGNSLLAAMYSGRVAANEISGRAFSSSRPDFGPYIDNEMKKLKKNADTKSSFPVMMIRDMLAKTMNTDLGIVRSEEGIKRGISDVDYLLSVSESIKYDSTVLPYFNYSLTGILSIARATLEMSLQRKESRGAHFRSDHPESDQSLSFASLISYDGGKYNVYLDKEHIYEN